MNQPDPQFRLVMRGYDPADVDRAISGLQQRASRGRGVGRRVRDPVAAGQRLGRRRPGPAEPPGYDHLGQRVGQILALADEEAKELRERAHAEVEDARKLAEQASVSVRDEADQYADQRRRDADSEAAQVVADAKRAADEERDAAERDAAALRQEGEAVFEQQRANAAKAAADFETTLAERRDRTTAEFQQQQAATQSQLDDMIQRVEETRLAAQREQEGAEAEARRVVLEAEERAANLVREARTTADRVRTESERELAAATQRRDSINAQLTNVRQMLATLTGSAAGFAVDPLPDEAPVPDAEDAAPEADEPAIEAEEVATDAEETGAVRRGRGAGGRGAQQVARFGAGSAFAEPSGPAQPADGLADLRPRLPQPGEVAAAARERRRRPAGSGSGGPASTRPVRRYVRRFADHPEPAVSRPRRT